MTYWLDAQLDRKIAKWLAETFAVDVRTLWELGLREAGDPEIYRAARAAGGVTVVTKDRDFVELLVRLKPPPQVIHLAFANLYTSALKVKLQATFPAAAARIEAGEPLVVVD